VGAFLTGELWAVADKDDLTLMRGSEDKDVLNRLTLAERRLEVVELVREAGRFGVIGVGLIEEDEDWLDVDISKRDLDNT
jgi:hypothetical protein